jgi:hypothetical protein
MADLNKGMVGERRGDDPAIGAVAITGSAQTLAVSGRGLLVTTTGNLVATMQDGSSITWASVPVNVYPLAIKAITSFTGAGYILV